MSLYELFFNNHLFACFNFTYLFFSQDDLWIVKPPANNNGAGIHVINRPESLDPTKQACVQKYIRDPLLINGLKVILGAKKKCKPYLQLL